MPSLSLLDRADPETNDSPSLLTRVSSRVFGDPRKAPKRLAILFVFGLFGLITTGLWLIVNSSIDTSGSSAPVVGPVLQILTSVWLVPVLALYLTRRWVFFRRGRNAGLAADVTGWSVNTVNHLREEIQTTDGCTRIIASTGDAFEDIAGRIDSALEGEHDDDTVDFWEADDHAEDFDIGHDMFADDEDTGRIEELIDEEQALIKEYNANTDRIDELLGDALDGEINPWAVLESDDDMASLYDLMDGGSRDAVDEAQILIDECEQIQQQIDDVRDEIEAATAPDDDGLEADAKAVRDQIQQGYTAAIDLSDELYEVMNEPEFDVPDTDAEADSRERQIPWRVRFMEEMKHLWLDLQSGFRTGDAVVKFGVPAIVTFVLQLFAVGLWTHPVVYALFITTSTIVGLFWYWVVKRRRQRRLKRYRADSSSDYWLDCAGQFKTVETADVTVYMGFIAGRRYASYDREEFVRKTARTMHQHVSDECVAPSDLQHYARCLEQMKPNLKGHRENVLRPLILKELKETVETADDDIIPKAELAWSVIEQPTSSRIERKLGHDPELVCEEYEWLVEDAHILDERDVEFRDANGDVQVITLVFPAEKRRLPDVSERHSQFSDRFTDRKGEAVYKLPDVDPRDGLQGFVPTPQAAALFDGADPAAVARSN
ncbi:hypothetical protein [Natronorubrum texcoconense]|uniref:Uncharacterized protein n=1 Tax=Natronorubrum texcoconense TaxID=1095776 RepID=A0A1G9H8G3_9EURY|nr:hypothetical protein [Natronorubrum texcoconense]SDL09179.1 hypothetical protein SAMN04515672_0144 [Natronorubrum texcoconense]